MYTKESIANIANIVLDALAEANPKYKNPPFLTEKNKLELIELLGGKLEYKSYSEWDESDGDGVIEPHDNSFKIILPMHTSTVRDIFTIAHELGHLFIHMDYGTEKFKQKRHNRTPFIDHMDLTEDNIIQEKEANHFGANFLMPEKLFRDRFKTTNGDIENLSKYFGVSKSAISTRAKFLGLIEW